MDNSLIDDSNDSAMFVSSLTQKRKASSNLCSKNLKQAKITSFEPTFSENSCLNVPKEMVTQGNEKLSEVEVKSTEATKLLNNLNNIESTSAYFEKKKKSMSNCPLCLKLFENEAYHLAHMKQCAKKNKMSTQQLLNALELQKKHMKERRDLGLPSQTFLKPKKAVKKKEEEENQNIEGDLALGIALSKSLEKNNSKSNYKEEQYPVLDEFGFTVNSKTKNKRTCKSVLKERTKEERQRIITEKAAIVLLQEDQEIKIKKQNLHENFINLNPYLLKFQNKLSRLWKLSENEENFDWYVEKIKNFMLTSHKENIKEKERETEFNFTNISTVDFHNELQKLNLPKHNILQDWKKMINNVEFSDLNCTSKDEQTFYFHSLVACVRCPVMLKKDFKYIFKNFCLSTILIFLEYLYCGTLNGLVRTKVEHLKILAKDFDFKELINVLNDLKMNLIKNTTISEQQTPLSDTPDLVVDEIKMKDSKDSFEKTKKRNEAIFLEDKDLFDDEMIDLTQSSHGSSTFNEEENEFNVEKTYWNFSQYEEKKKEEELRKEEERENSIISTEMEKIKTSMKQQKEIMDKILNEYEEKESDMQNKLELEKIYEMQRSKSNDSIAKDVEDDLVLKRIRNSTIEDCILLSSDSDTKNSRPEVETPPLQDTPLCEVPSFNPYENYNFLSDCNYSPVVHSQSLLAGIEISNEKIDSLHETLRADEKALTSNLNALTPVTLRRSPRIKSSNKKSEKNRKRRSDLISSRIIRKSLNLSFKSLKPTSNKKKSLKCNKRKNNKKDNEWLEELTSSILDEFNKSPLMRSSTPIQSTNYVEHTPKQNKEVEIEESVTPYPNYSRLEEASLKEHLAKYGLKKNLGRKKGSKILKLIYEELHPFLNTETGKLVKKMSSETPKTSKIKKRNNNKISKNIKSLKQSKKNSPGAEKFRTLSAESSNKSDQSSDCVDKSTDCYSDNNMFENFEEVISQSVPSDPLDLSSAMKKFLELNPDFHCKILLYEPIWLGDLQKKLKEAVKKHFKISDIMDYLDQKCITFRSETQKKNNEKRNERKKKTKIKRNHST